MVECESPSEEPMAVNRLSELIADRLSGVARVRRAAGGRYGRHLQCEFRLPGRRKEGRLLVLGHLDTVWPLGALKQMPFRRHAGRLWGPGVLDMKSGVAFFIFAMQALRDLEIPVLRRVLLQLNSDEEVGSESSRALTEREARRASAVLVLEPGAGLEGKLKTARKGVGTYTVEVEGKAAHAGIDPAAGASAIVEMARQITRIAAFSRPARGITVNPGVVSGGSRSNVVAAQARMLCDVRVPRMEDAAALDRQFGSLRPVDPRCRLTVTGGVNRPPLERTPAIASLFRTARKLGRELGVEIEESSTGGGSDGNFTAALGIPTLDGLGGVGEGAHAINESILISRIADRTALLAKLIAASIP
jgi:glutamate carboxypeptidase